MARPIDERSRETPRILGLGVVVVVERLDDRRGVANGKDPRIRGRAPPIEHADRRRDGAHLAVARVEKRQDLTLEVLDVVNSGGVIVQPILRAGIVALIYPGRAKARSPLQRVPFPDPVRRNASLSRSHSTERAASAQVDSVLAVAQRPRSDQIGNSVTYGGIRMSVIAVKQQQKTGKREAQTNGLQRSVSLAVRLPLQRRPSPTSTEKTLPRVKLNQNSPRLTSELPFGAQTLVYAAGDTPSVRMIELVTRTLALQDMVAKP